MQPLVSQYKDEDDSESEGEDGEEEEEEEEEEGDDEEVEPPKVLGDVLESLAGAIFMDSGLDLQAVWGSLGPLFEEKIGEWDIQHNTNHNRFPTIIYLLNVVYESPMKCMQCEFCSLTFRKVQG